LLVALISTHLTEVFVGFVQPMVIAVLPVEIEPLILLTFNVTTGAVGVVEPIPVGVGVGVLVNVGVGVFVGVEVGVLVGVGVLEGAGTYS
jgi:hypothetical protein